MLDTIVGSYRITGKIAVGGMGTVYRAEHTLIGRTAAIKVLHPEMTQSRDIVNRFFNEAKATSTIKHPGIVEVFDFGHMESGHAYLVMEFLEGETLAQRMKHRGIVPEGESAMLMRGVCGALAAAHAKGIVHRDLKPDNIFIVPEPESAMGERTKILDFGIAKLTDIGQVSSQTKTGAVMGTPTYMSPEQCRGAGEVDHRADLYSIGCMLYELCVGRPPFNVSGAGELLGCHLFVEPDPPSRYGRVSPEMEALIMRLLRKKPEERIQTAQELGQQLVHIAQLSGWISVSNTDPSGRFSVQHMPPMPTPMHMTPAHLTPGVMQFTPGPAHIPAIAPQAPTVFAQSDKPTTLSGAASQSVVSNVDAIHRPRRGLTMAVGGLLVAAAAGIAFVVVGSSHRGVTPAKEIETKPIVIDTKTTEPAPTPTNVEPPKPAVDTKVEVKTEPEVVTAPETKDDTKTDAKVDTKTDAKLATDTKVDPRSTKTVKTTVTQKVKTSKTKTDHEKKPDKVDKPSKGGDLLETDL
ncbi:MAG TPA: serine/threonine-protein kinase [Kofleriaceae bacterium]